jgi:hypothetical protein
VSYVDGTVASCPAQEPRLGHLALLRSTGYREVILRATRPGEPGTLIARDRRPGFAQQSSAQTASTEYKLAAGDYVEAEVAQTSRGDLPMSKLSYTRSWVAPG